MPPFQVLLEGYGFIGTVANISDARDLAYRMASKMVPMNHKGEIKYKVFDKNNNSVGGGNCVGI